MEKHIPEYSEEFAGFIGRVEVELKTPWDKVVRAVNSHEALLEALRELVAEFDERNKQKLEELGEGYGTPEDTGGITVARILIAQAEKEA